MTDKRIPTQFVMALSAMMPTHPRECPECGVGLTEPYLVHPLCLRIRHGGTIPPEMVRLIKAFKLVPATDSLIKEAP